MSRNTFEMPPGVVGTGHLVDVLQGFVHELRAAGLPVSMTENLDAMRAVEHISMQDREALKAVLGATLVKQHRHRKAFETVFEVYFALWSPGINGEDDGGGSDGAQQNVEGSGSGNQPGGGGGGEGISNEDLAEMLMQALMQGDERMQRNLAAMADALQLDYGFELAIDKGIPLASGLGGSAASAVAAVVAAGALLDAPIEPNAPMHWGGAAADGMVTYHVRRMPLALAASFVAGNLSSLLGIGGGVVKVPILNAWCGVPMRAACIVASTACASIATATSSPPTAGTPQAPAR